MPESPPQNSPPGPNVIKRALLDAGFEVFRTRGDEVVLAERPRENLIMDSGVRVRGADPFEVRVVLRAQKADYPGDDDITLFDRVRRLSGALSAGFAEVDAAATPLADPGDPKRTLDTFFEVTYAKPVPTLSDAIAEVRKALSVEKHA